ncbi:MAG: SMI1/KNR4 family protein [Acutalibacteraceae bacterium]
MKLFDIFNTTDDLLAGHGVDNTAIDNAEKSLSLSFSIEYRSYLEIYGIVAVNGHELTGISNSKRTNVVNVTLEERCRNDNIQNDWYVVEQANIDGIVIWQTETGFIYQTSPNLMPKKICNSLAEYIELF